MSLLSTVFQLGYCKERPLGSRAKRRGPLLAFLGVPASVTLRTTAEPLILEAGFLQQSQKPMSMVSLYQLLRAPPWGQTTVLLFEWLCLTPTLPGPLLKAEGGAGWISLSSPIPGSLQGSSLSASYHHLKPSPPAEAIAHC